MTCILTKLTGATLITTISVSTSFVAAADPNKRKFDEQRYFGGNSHMVSSQLEQLQDKTSDYNKGIRLFNKGKFGLAEISFKRSLGGRNNHYQANAYLGIINIKQNDHKSAVRYLRTAVSGNPYLYSLKSTLGLSYIEIGKPEKAEAILAKLKKHKDKADEVGPDQIELDSSIAVLEQALTNI